MKQGRKRTARKRAPRKEKTGFEPPKQKPKFHSHGYPVDIESIEGLSVEHWIVYGHLYHLAFRCEKPKGYAYKSRRKMAERWGWVDASGKTGKLDRAIRKLVEVGAIKTQRTSGNMQYYPLIGEEVALWDEKVKKMEQAKEKKAKPQNGDSGNPKMGIRETPKCGLHTCIPGYVPHESNQSTSITSVASENLDRNAETKSQDEDEVVVFDSDSESQNPSSETHRKDQPPQQDDEKAKAVVTGKQDEDSGSKNPSSTLDDERQSQNRGNLFDSENRKDPSHSKPQNRKRNWRNRSGASPQPLGNSLGGNGTHKPSVPPAVEVNGNGRAHRPKRSLTPRDGYIFCNATGYFHRPDEDTARLVAQLDGQHQQEAVQ